MPIDGEDAALAADAADVPRVGCIGKDRCCLVGLQPMDLRAVVGLLQERVNRASGILLNPVGVDVGYAGRIQVQAAAVEHEGADRGLLKDDAVSRADDGLSVAEDIPGQPYSRRNVLVVRWVRRADPLPDLHQSGGRCRDVIGQQVVAILDRVGDVIAESQIQRYPLRSLHVVFQKEPHRFLAHIAMRIAVEETPAPYIARHEIPQMPEVNPAAAIPGAVVVDIAIAECSAESKGLPPRV